MHTPVCFLKLWNKLRKQTVTMVTVAKDGSVIFLSFQTNELQQTVDKACDVCYFVCILRRHSSTAGQFCLNLRVNTPTF